MVYCQADCWMSWNAAKRLLSYGYSNVAWYPEGTDGWERAGLPIAERSLQPGGSPKRRLKTKHDVGTASPR